MNPLTDHIWSAILEQRWDQNLQKKGCPPCLRGLGCEGWVSNLVRHNGVTHNYLFSPFKFELCELDLI